MDFGLGSEKSDVSILVLMDILLLPEIISNNWLLRFEVSILVLMDILLLLNILN